MKLKRLRIEQLRQFRQPLEISNFESGINLFTGPNESGKSTIVRAIRAAFFERHRSSSVEDLCPWGNTAATPTIEIDFDIGDTAYSLTKSFLYRKRCELKIGNQLLESTDAEDRLAELFGYQFAAKGPSKPEHWGIPGLLWIEQGTGQDVHEAVGFAKDHLHNVLKETLGEIASSGGDEVLERVRMERAMLLTATGKPTGALSKVTSELADASARKTDLEALISTYRQQVDTLGSLRQQYAADETERPWERFHTELKVADDKHASILQLNKTLTQDRNQLIHYDDKLKLLRQQIADYIKQTEDLVTRENSLARAIESVQLTTAAYAPFTARQQVAEAAYQQAREVLRLARQEDQRSMLQVRIQDAQPRLLALADAITATQSAQALLTDLRKLAVSSEIDKRDLSNLQKQHNALREMAIRQEAIATRLKFELVPGKSLTLNGETISDQDERLLVSTGELGIPGSGRILITPGGTDLAALARQKDELQDAHQSQLQRIGVASLEAAMQRDTSYQQQLIDIRQAEHTLALHAPKGLDALVAEQGEINSRVTDAQATLAQLPDAPKTVVLSQQQAEDQQEHSREALEAITRETINAKQAMDTAMALHDNAQRERDALRDTLQDSALQQRYRDASQRLLETNTERNALAQRIDSLAQQISESHPDILEQDIQRLRMSAEQTEKQFRSMGEDIIRLQTQLESLGAQGLEEQDAGLTALVDRLSRRQAELTQRSMALDLLLNLLEDKRRVLTRRLQAPLQRHFNHYLHLLFPQASLDIDENLTPGPLTRPGVRGGESGVFKALSFGAREQMGVISRLAYADLLQEAGRPTLIIFDDVLVHSDEQRLAQMKRIVFDAGQRHQILLFTCHPTDWRDLGVSPRSIDSLRITEQS